MKKEIVVEVGCDGGTITLVREGSEEDWTFRLDTDETAIEEMLSEEDRKGIVFRSSSTGVRTFEEALKLLDRRKWAMLYPLQVHPEYREAILSAVRERVARSEDPEAGRHLAQWERCTPNSFWR